MKATTSYKLNSELSFTLAFSLSQTSFNFDQVYRKLHLSHQISLVKFSIQHILKVHLLKLADNNIFF
jgi:long-subunit fatty acid transport protein